MANERELVKLEGAAELQKIFNEFPLTVQAQASKKGLSRAGSRLAALIRREAPKETGDLRKAIGVKRYRGGMVTGGLNRKVGAGGNKRVPYYYKTLEFGYPSGRGPYHKFFGRAWSRHRDATARLIVEETKKAIYQEAGKAYARSRSRLRKR